jgi:response regulator NasT
MVDARKQLLRIAAADEHDGMRRSYRKTLARLGYQEVGVVGCGRDLVDLCRAERPDLVILGTTVPEPDGFDALEELSRLGPVPVIVVSEHPPTIDLDGEGSKNVFAHLLRPIGWADLEAAIPIARMRFLDLQASRAAALDVRHELEGRKLVEKAKGILMRKGRLDEQGAYDRLRKLARDQNQKLSDAARWVIRTETACLPRRD